MTEEDFQKCFTILENEFGKQSIALREIWYELFKNYKKEELKEAIIYYLKRIKKFPLIPDIKEYTEHFKKEKAEKSYCEALCIINKINTKYRDSI